MTKQRIYIDGNLFLGRIEEQEAFREALRNVRKLTDESLPFVFLIQGEGGMGKSVLTRRLQDIAQQEIPFENSFNVLRIDWELIRYRTPSLRVAREQINPKDVLNAIHRAVLDEKWGHYFKDYQQALQKQQQIERDIDSSLHDDKNLKDYAALMELGAGGLSKLVRSSLPVIGQTGEDLSKELLAAGLKIGADQVFKLRQLAEKFLRSRLTQESYEIYRQPLEQLSRAFGIGFHSLSRSRPLILILDTYEIVSPTTDIWLRHIIKSAGPRIIWIIAGRNNLATSRPSDRYVGYSDEFGHNLNVWDLHELAEEDVTTYLMDATPGRSITSDEIETLQKASHGIPLLLPQVADLWSKGVDATEIAEGIDTNIPRETLVRLVSERTLIHLEQSKTGLSDRYALYALAMQSRPDPEIQTRLLRPETGTFNLHSRLVELARLYSVVKIVGGARLHETIGDFIREYLLSTEESANDMVSEIANKAIITLRTRRQILEDNLFDLAEKFQSLDWQQCIQDIVHWLFWLDESQAWRELIPRFVEGLGYDEDFAKSLLTIADSFKIKFGKDGHRRLQKIQLPEENRANLLYELERLANRGRWLDDDNEESTAERQAIILLWRGRWLIKEEQYGQALEVLQNSSSLLPEHAVFLKNQLGNAFVSLSASMSFLSKAASYSLPTDDSLSAAKLGVQINPESYEAWIQLGRTLDELGHYQDAVKAMEKAVELDPDRPSAWFHLGRFVYSRAGLQDKALESSQRAVHIIQKLLEEDESNFGNWNRLGLVYTSLARYDDAIAAYTKALEIAPDRMYVSWQNMGVALQSLERYDEAINAYKKAIELNPQYAIPWHSLGSLYRILRKYEEAIEAFKKALEIEPFQPNFYLSLGRMYDELGEYSQAKNIYLQALEHARNARTKASIYSNLGWNYVSEENLNKASEAFSQAVELQPENIFFRARLAYVLQSLGQSSQANQQAENARENFPKSESYYNRACLEALLGDLQAALNNLEQALSQRPELRNWAKTDPDLMPLRSKPEFENLVS